MALSLGLTSFMALSKSCLCGALGGMHRWPQSLSEVMNTPTACCSSLVRLSLWSCSISYRYSDNFGPCWVKQRGGEQRKGRMKNVFVTKENHTQGWPGEKPYTGSWPSAKPERRKQRENVTMQRPCFEKQGLKTPGKLYEYKCLRITRIIKFLGLIQ